MTMLQHYFASAGEHVSPHLAAEECKCHCWRCKPLRTWQVVTPKAGGLFERIRHRCGDRPIHVNSAVRCPEHNADYEDQGAVSDSQHVVGQALDLRCPEGMALAEFHQICDEEAGLSGCGFYDWGCHVDVRTIPAGRTKPYRWGKKA